MREPFLGGGAGKTISLNVIIICLYKILKPEYPETSEANQDLPEGSIFGQLLIHGTGFLL